MVNGSEMIHSPFCFREGQISASTHSPHFRLRACTVASILFGFYSFDNVAAGQSYTIAISSRLYRFQPRTMQVSGDLANVDFVGLE